MTNTTTLPDSVPTYGSVEHPDTGKHFAWPMFRDAAFTEAYLRGGFRFYKLFTTRVQDIEVAVGVFYSGTTKVCFGLESDVLLTDQLCNAIVSQLGFAVVQAIENLPNELSTTYPQNNSQASDSNEDPC